VRRRLLALATREQKEGAERYFRHVVTFHGVETAGMRDVARAMWPVLAKRPDREIVRQAFALLEAEAFEEKHVGILLLERVAKRLDAAFVAAFEPVFDRAVNNWGTCDAVCGRVMRPLIADAAARRRIVAWSRARHAWRQRAAAVAFLGGARHGRNGREILAVCRRIARTDERFAQLGMGWVLRELWLADPEAVIAFLRAHAPRIRREALRYAIEKMPPALQQTLLADHARARAER
jgi:3-methyladenine DNA glycosylase AlkD